MRSRGRGPAPICPEERAVHLLVGGRIRACRRARGLVLKQIAAEVGLTVAQLSWYELGKGAISIGRLSRVAQVLGVPLRDLVDPPGQPEAA